ncbi:MAG: hypothetical protein LUE27_09960 [Clostridia bacterium]|nr:hypothetical protein [Clostridia bacterium]
MNLPPLITKEQAAAIERTFISPEEKREYYKYIHIYNVLRSFATSFGLVRAQFYEKANQLQGFLWLLAAHEEEERNLNTIHRLTNVLAASLYYGAKTDPKDEPGKDVEKRDTYASQIEHLMELLNDRIKTFDLFDADVTVCDYSIHSDSKEEFHGLREVLSTTDMIQVDNSGLWDLVKSLAASTEKRMIQYKSAIIATENWTKSKRGGKDFMPSLIRDCIKEEREDDYSIPAEFSARALAERIAKGEQVTDEDRERAIFPSFNQVEPDKKLIEEWTKRIKATDKYGD